MTVIIYSVYSFAVIGLDEIYSVWCKTDPDLGKPTSVVQGCSFLFPAGSNSFWVNISQHVLYSRELFDNSVVMKGVSTVKVLHS